MGRDTQNASYVSMNNTLMSHYEFLLLHFSTKMPETPKKRREGKTLKRGRRGRKWEKRRVGPLSSLREDSFAIVKFCHIYSQPPKIE